jgi:hypothetical protein
MKPVSLIVIPGLCCNQGCRRVSVRAVKLSDFWVTYCAKCQGTEITLDMDKIGAVLDAEKELGHE